MSISPAPPPSSPRPRGSGVVDGTGDGRPLAGDEHRASWAGCRSRGGGSLPGRGARRAAVKLLPHQRRAGLHGNADDNDSVLRHQPAQVRQTRSAARGCSAPAPPCRPRRRSSPRLGRQRGGMDEAQPGSPAKRRPASAARAASTSAPTAVGKQVVDHREEGPVTAAVVQQPCPRAAPPTRGPRGSASHGSSAAAETAEELSPRVGAFAHRPSPLIAIPASGPRSDWWYQRRLSYPSSPAHRRHRVSG